ncbi:nucleoside deaminase [Herbiconiux sp. 11R-BC]|uniref:nucleoside deaminase n=1 Tax=Herbiconiux sp. 11R-BC TaxID=3111637 RepID=UPI003C0AB628
MSAAAAGVAGSGPSPAEMLAVAVAEARAGAAEGGVPVGAALFVDGELVGAGHNQRVQLGSPIHHGETACLADAGRLPAGVYARATMVTTLSPCIMCTGAILLYKIPRVIVGENSTFLGAEELLRSHGVEVTVLDDADCVEIMARFIREHPDIWNEDISV